MSFRVVATTDPAVKTITCDQCGDSKPSKWEKERDSWKRGHVCIRAERLSERTAVRG